MVDIHAHPGGSLPIGRRGENLARRVIFDLAPWRKCYGDGTVQLLHQRAGDADPYPCALTVEGDTAYWLIRAADVDKPGWGDAQLHYYVGETLAKSSAWRTLTADALGAPGETPPEPQQDWVEKVLAAGTAAEDAAGRAEEAAVHPPYPSEETGTWWTWNAEAGKYEDTGLSYSGSGEGGTTDHTKLTNRNADDQHPMSAITGLVGALGGKVSVSDIINNLTTNAANKPLSAAQGVALKALIDAISIPEKLPNPHALTFTGAVEGSYDGSAAKTINIPSSGGEPEYDYEKFIVLGEAVTSYIIDTFDDGTPLALSSLEVISVTKNNTASTVNINVMTDLPNTANAGKLSARTIGGYTGAGKWMYSWLEAKIRDGECRADFASEVNVTRYINFYSGIYLSNTVNHIKLIPAITFSADTTEIFPNKVTKFTSVEIDVAAGSMESGSMIRIRGVKA